MCIRDRINAYSNTFSYPPRNREDIFKQDDVAGILEFEILEIPISFFENIKNYLGQLIQYLEILDQTKTINSNINQEKKLFGRNKFLIIYLIYMIFDFGKQLNEVNKQLEQKFLQITDEGKKKLTEKSEKFETILKLYFEIIQIFTNYQCISTELKSKQSIYSLLLNFYKNHQ
eukprot:TRINITY_DN6128_c0_g1_i1.p2 TRINITY_DN6128_c0_g1~~TRINITY_DN6128_c0_g1_i1.p2  ORF type:complete len:173 (-),score=33.43 TRINITY_DN6128_c0_g1_i1:516-1034(-)